MEAFSIVLIVFIGCASGVLIEWMKRAPKTSQKQLLAEIRELRDEVRQLRLQNNDVILHLDRAAHEADRRLSRLEQRGELPGSELASGEPQPLMLSRDR